MIEINRHIEILLLKNECVIIPDFGGFMTHYVGARYNDQEHLFLPPMRTLGFNPQLRMNDSVLAQSYVEAYDISYPEALRKIEEEVADIKHVLEQKGTYTMDDLGVLTVNQEGNIEFAPCQAGILTPDLYGLTDLSFNTLKKGMVLETSTEEVKTAPVQVEVVEEKAEEKVDDNVEETADKSTLLDFTDDKEDSGTITIKKSWIRNTIAVAAAVVVFFLLSTPVVNSEMGTSTMTHLQHNILYKLIPQDTNFMKAEPVEEDIDTMVADNLDVEKEEEETTEAELKAAEKENAEPVATDQPTYLIIVASQVKMSNAELYVEQLHEQGYPQAKLFIYNNVVRVACGEYNTEGEAYNILHKMHSKEDFADAWVFKKKAETE